jgi:hypothetical protein
MSATNTIPAALQRDLILDAAMRAFEAGIAPVLAFATRFNDVALEGTDILSVPYYPLETAASADFNGTYAFANSTTSSKSVTINKRKYQSLQMTSQEQARQPYLSREKIAVMKAEKLAQDICEDIFSVFTVANFGAAAHSGDAIAFDADDIRNLKGVADVANWPTAGRSIVLNSAFDVNVGKDVKLSSALNYGSAEGIREGQVPRIHGFDYRLYANMPTNSANLAGLIAFMSAVLVGFSPIRPAKEVLDNLSEYKVVTGKSGLSLEYRCWGNPDGDDTREVIECNYGFARGEAAAAKLIVTP